MIFCSNITFKFMISIYLIMNKCIMFFWSILILYCSLKIISRLFNLLFASILFFVSFSHFLSHLKFNKPIACNKKWYNRYNCKMSGCTYCWYKRCNSYAFTTNWKKIKLISDNSRALHIYVYVCLFFCHSHISQMNSHVFQ